MTNKEIIVEITSQVLHPLGFKRRGITWQRDDAEIICIVNFQKSNYENGYFINIAFLLRNDDSPSNPKEHQCDIRFRATQLWPNESTIFEKALAENKEACFKNALQTFLIEQITPFIEQCAGYDGLRTVLQSGISELGLIRQSARKALCLAF